MMNKPRMILYQFLALAFYEPGESLLEVLTDPNPERLAEAGRRFLGPEGEVLVEKLLELLQDVHGNQKDALVDLKVEYNRLFVGPMPPVCPPYESFYDEERPSEDHGTLFGPSVEAMAQALSAEGLELTLEYAELADHAAIELEFMYYLLSQAEAQKEDAGIYLQKANNFFIEHLAKWLPQFGSQVARESHHPFYRNAGQLLAAVINADLSNLGLHRANINGHR